MKFSIFSLLACSIISAFSANAQTPVPCEAPYPQVQGLSAEVDFQGQSVNLSWIPVLGSQGCRIQLRQEGTIPWLTRTLIEPDLDSASISGAFLAYQSNYDARVACGCSTNPLIIGPYSEIVSFNTGSGGQQVPCENPYPEVLNPSAASTAENDAIVLSWNPIPQSLGCQIEYSLLEGGVLNTAQIFENELSSFAIPEGDLIPNQDYQWRVRCGCSLNPLVAGPWIEYQEFNSGSVGELSFPEADFRAQPICAVEGKPVLFSNLANDSSQTYLWDFGDGTTSTEINPTKIYSEPGIYTVSLTVSNSSAQAGEVKSEYVTVNAASCPATVTDIDGNTYDVVQICEECWMAENLKTTKYSNGDAIPKLETSSWYSTSSGAWDDYEGTSNYGTENERFYNWYTTVDSRNLCPSGWHVSTDEDWIAMELILGMPAEDTLAETLRGGEENIGGAIKTDSFDPPNVGANNILGFNSRGLGYKNCCINSSGPWFNLGNNEFFWVPTSGGGILGLDRATYTTNGAILRNFNHKRFGFSIRCVQD
jgi:uncharacterized protein (TIGR02145 family)